MLNFYELDNNWCFTYFNINEPNHYLKAELKKNIWEEYEDLVGTPFHQACIKAMKEQQNTFVKFHSSLNDTWWEEHIYPSISGLSVYSENITDREIAEDKLKTFQNVYLKDFGVMTIKDGKRNDKKIDVNLELLLKNFNPRNKCNATITIPTAEGVNFIKVIEILYCKASGNYTDIFLKGGKKYLVSRQLKEYEELLSNFNFFRIHHSSLIHLDYIQSYIRGDGGYVIMSDNAVLDVARRKKDSFLERIGYKLYTAN